VRLACHRALQRDNCRRLTDQLAQTPPMALLALVGPTVDAVTGPNCADSY
jgi:hypothetical protein